jgi:peptide/nickel transport system permease protein
MAGLPRRSLLLRHALRNAAIPVVTAAGLFAIAMLGGTILVEQVFVLPGMGSLVVQAAADHDLPVIEGAVLYFTVIVIAVNLLIDLSYAWLNPRVRVTA